MKIRGEGTISNDMSCNEFKTYSTSDVRGNMKVKNYVVYGDSEVQGNVDAEYVKVYGNTQIHGDAIFKIRGGILQGSFQVILSM